MIFEAAQELFKAKGFDAVSVAEIARAADVSEVTVFNYFPTKEDLFYGGMAVFEESLLEGVRARRPGEAASKAFRRALLDSAANLVSNERAAAIAKASKLIAASPSLLARERAIAEHYTRLLAELLAQETGANPDEVEAMAVASATSGRRPVRSFMAKRSGDRKTNEQGVSTGKRTGPARGRSVGELEAKPTAISRLASNTCSRNWNSVFPTS